jgi:protein-S-isoprenylcysteine O-methyltransferase Ste14
MRFLHAFVGLVLFFEIPIPVYWLILHPLRSFWRTRIRAAFWFAGLAAWISGGFCLWIFRHTLLAVRPWPWLSVVAGFALIGIEAYLFVRVERELGGKRLVGHAELTGGGEMFSGGLYSHVRHPRYAGMLSAALGVALICGTPLLWIVLAIWWPFALLVIRLEEKELASRFGPRYEDYRRRVPAFLPLNLHPIRKS